MAGFVSVRPSARVGSVVARALACGWVWACRPLPAGGLAAGFSPAPACLFVPFCSRVGAIAFLSVAGGLGWRAWARPGSARSPVFSACGLAVPAWCVKVALPPGVSASAARVRLAPFGVSPSGAVLGALAWAL